MQWFGKPVPFNRFLGQVDQDDPTNLPVGVAALCENTDFTRDSPGVTCANTRAGVNLAMQLVGTDGKTAKDSATGGIFFQYEPELASDADLFPPAGYFSMPILFEKGGCLQRENPVGTGRCQKLPASPIFTPPVGAHMIGAPAGNKVFAAFSDLLKPLSGCVSIDPKAIATNGTNPVAPLGMKPFGWQWQPNTNVLVGEYCTPPSPDLGNGHTYRCITAGKTAAAAPAFATAEGATFADGTAEWQESTMVLANRLPAPAAPTLTRVPAGGTLPAGQDVYVVITLVNHQGETVTSLQSVLLNTNLNDAVQAAVPALAALAGWIQTLDPAYAPSGANVYVAIVAHAAQQPPLSAYLKFGSTVALGTNVLVTTSGSGAAPPTASTARVVPGQLPTPDAAPVVQRVPAGGTFPAGRDVYLRKTFTNSLGETKAGPQATVVNTVLNDGVQVNIEVPEDDNGEALYTITSVGIYEADVPTGDPAPALEAYNLVGFYSVGSTPTVTTSGTGQNPPTANTTGPGGNIQRNTDTGGPNGTQGYRYATVIFVNQNETFSGFTIASLVSYIVDEDGWELGVFNIPTGPSNIVARCVVFTAADVTQSGGHFNWIGILNLILPSANFVYPQTVTDGGVNQTATAIFDNVTTKATFNFTDAYLDSSNNVDDRTDILPPFQACRIDYLKSVNCLAYSGVLGYSGGGLISIPGDYESVYADTGQVLFPADGKKCFGFTDAYKSVIFGLREDGGYALQPSTGDAAGWVPVQRWSEVGPCGFRAWAAIGKFIFFVHRSGAYKYDQSDPDMMSKEIPRRWSTINWAAAEQIAVSIDEDTHTVRIHVPTGTSTVNNEEFVLSYLEGWQNPLHFSTYSGKEIAMDAARRWSFNNVAANFSMRMDRKLPAGPAFIDGPNWEAMPDSAYRQSQLLFFSSADDGTVHARTPGIYSDNGAGIPWNWESVCAGLMQSVCKPEGINLNASGSGRIYASVIAGRKQITDDQDDSQNQDDALPFIVPLGEGYFDLVESQSIGITLKCEPAINEFWRMHFDNGKLAGVWCSLKLATFYIIPVTGGRDSR